MRASTAWADESFQEHDTAGFYIIAAVIIPASAQERARALMLEAQAQAQARHAPAKLHWVCLHQLVLELHGFGVEQLFMEARQPTLNARDVTTVQHARYTLPKGTRFRVDHLPGAGEALLWVADIVAGAVRPEKLGDPRYREILGERVIDFPVTVL